MVFLNVLLIFESILPIFLLVIAGAALKRAPVIDRSFWPGLEQFGFYVIFPLYLFLTIAKADFQHIAIGPLSLTYGGAWVVLVIVLLAAQPTLARLGVSKAQFTTVLQTATRWNGFVALAIAERTDGPTAVAIIALLMGIIVIPINLVNITTLVWYGGGERHFWLLIKKVITNPIVVGTFFGLALALTNTPIYQPLDTAISLVARSALGLGLLLVGAGLRLSELSKPTLATYLGVTLKLVAFPVGVIAATTLLGFDPLTVRSATLAASVPTALNGYLLARQMGGDAPLYAATATWQTAASFFTIPAMLMLADMASVS